MSVSRTTNRTEGSSPPIGVSEKMGQKIQKGLAIIATPITKVYQRVYQMQQLLNRQEVEHLENVQIVQKHFMDVLDYFERLEMLCEPETSIDSIVRHNPESRTLQLPLGPKFNEQILQVQLLLLERQLYSDEIHGDQEVFNDMWDRLIEWAKPRLEGRDCTIVDTYVCHLARILAGNLALNEEREFIFRRLQDRMADAGTRGHAMVEPPKSYSSTMLGMDHEMISRFNNGQLAVQKIRSDVAANPVRSNLAQTDRDYIDFR